MQPDRYTRVVLTVIAVCLVWICLRDVAIVKPAHAAGPMDVKIVGIDFREAHDTIGVEIKRVSTGALPVRFTSTPTVSVLQMQ